MFDFDLQMRFFRAAADTFFQVGEASMAAVCAWQDEMDTAAPAVADAPETPNLGDMFPMMAPMTAMWLDKPKAKAVPNFFAKTRYAQAAAPRPAWAAFWDFDGLMQPRAGAELAHLWDGSWVHRWMPWAAYRNPMMAAMISSGVPHAVAAPAARAGTSAMDAADAAHTQMQKWQRLFSTYQSPGGHASAQLVTANSARRRLN